MFHFFTLNNSMTRGEKIRQQSSECAALLRLAPVPGAALAKARETQTAQHPRGQRSSSCTRGPPLRPRGLKLGTATWAGSHQPSCCTLALPKHQNKPKPLFENPFSSRSRRGDRACARLGHSPTLPPHPQASDASCSPKLKEPKHLEATHDIPHLDAGESPLRPFSQATLRTAISSSDLH